jgi:tetratricopeptide (TPR) repeat protein
MKSLAIACLILLCLVAVSAQKRSGNTTHQQNTAQTANAIRVYLRGKVVTSDGTPFDGTPLIQSVCRGQVRNETHADVHGDFSFQFGDQLSSMSEAAFGADTSIDPRPFKRSAPNNPEDCELQASLSGYLSETISLSGRINGSENVDVGRIVLHRRSDAEDFTVSATTAAAPGGARKAFHKGQEQENGGQLDEAIKSFEKAVRLYPKFAAAWFELGNVQKMQNDFTAARTSFAASVAADDKYINPYRGLMQLAVHDQNWQEVVATSERLIALNPATFADAWFVNGVGHFYLQHFADAEKSARRGLAIDGSHRVPKLEYLLGMILVRNNNYPEAAQHFQAYLHLVSKAADIAEAQKQLAEVARLTAAQGQPLSQKK